MESMDSLVSPAKARQAAMQAKDWAYVNSWLNRQYAPKDVPAFERNEDTLRVLLSLAAANDAADEEASLTHRAREEGVRAFKTQTETDRQDLHEQQKSDILDEIEACLDDRGRRDLDDLAEAAVALGDTLDATPAGLGQSIAEITVEQFEVQGQISKIETLCRYLQQELERLRTELDALKTDPAFETPSQVQGLTSEWTRGTKMLASKVGEYQDRIASLERNQPRGPTIEQLMVEEEGVIRLCEMVKSLEARVRAFHDLPKNVAGARTRYKQLERELAQLTRQRDTMFGCLVERR